MAIHSSLVWAFIMPVLIRNRVVCFVFADDGLRFGIAAQAQLGSAGAVEARPV